MGLPFKLLSSLILIGALFVSGITGGPLSAETEVVPESYTLTITYPTGGVRTLEDVVSHALVPEDNPIFLSVVVEDGRRFLIGVRDRDFEFSQELDQILQLDTGDEVNGPPSAVIP